MVISPSPPPPSLPIQTGASAADLRLNDGYFKHRDHVFHVPSARGIFKEGQNVLEVGAQCGLRAIGGVSLGWQTHWQGPDPIPIETMAADGELVSYLYQFPEQSDGARVKVRVYATNAAGLASYADTSEVSYAAVISLT
jgi:hypothetical protein